MTDQFPPDPGDRPPGAVPPPATGPTGTGAVPPSTPAPRPRGSGPPPPPQVATELVDLVKAYAQQETLEPLRQLGFYLAWGLAGALLLGLGAIFLAMSALRALQFETGGTFTGKLVWIPYFIVVAGLAVTAAIAWSMRSKKREQMR